MRNVPASRAKTTMTSSGAGPERSIASLAAWAGRLEDRARALEAQCQRVLQALIAKEATMTDKHTPHRCENDHEQPWPTFIQFGDAADIAFCYRCWAEAQAKVFPTLPIIETRVPEPEERKP